MTKQFLLRLPLWLHKAAKIEAKAQRRSVTAQLIYWLLKGMPADLRREKDDGVSGFD